MGQLNPLITDSGTFEFDGINSENVLEDAILEIMELTSESSTIDFGADRDIEINQDGEFLSYGGFTKKTKDFDLCISKTNSQHLPLQYTHEDLRKIKKWIYKSSFLPLVKDGYTMYIMAEKGSMTLYGGDKGIIRITVKSLPYKYKYKEISKHVTNFADIPLQNLSEINDEDIKIDFEVKMSQGTSFKLTNYKTKEEFIIENMKEEENFKVTGEQNFIESLVNAKRNLYILTNKVFPKLEYGDNALTVFATEADVKISYAELYSI